MTKKPKTVKEIAETSDAAAEAIVHQHKNIATAAEDPKYEGIAVLGSHPETVLQAPFDDPKWLIYACSPHNFDIDHADAPTVDRRFLNGGRRPDGGVFRIDQWFEVHVPFPDETRPYSYGEELKKLDAVWMRDPDAARYFKGGRPFPQEEITERFGPFFWTSSIAFILAKAIVDAEQMGIKKIGIWGVMQKSENEYTYQRPGIQYWIQRATELDIQVLAPRESALFEPQQVKF